MSTSYTSLLGLALPTTGELSGTWGDTVNDYITKYVDAAVAGVQTISGSQTAVTLSTTNGGALTSAGSGSTGSAQYMIINCTGNPASELTVTAPATSKIYCVINATSTSQNVKIVGAGPTTGVVFIPEEVGFVAWTGTDFVKTSLNGISFGTTGLTPSTVSDGVVTVAGTLNVANGGTGATTLTGYVKGAGTSAFTASATIPTSDLSGTISVPNGGTGASTLTGYVKGNGASAFTAASTIPTTDLSGTITVPNGGTGASTLTGYVKGSGTSALTASSTIPVSDLTGTLGVANGGTGATTLTGVLIGNGTSAVTTKTNPSGAFVGTSDSQTLTNKSISGATNTITNVPLSTAVTGTLPVGNGGTGATTLTGILVGNGTSAVTAVAAPTGTIVGTTDTQTLTNKTLTSPTLTGPTINDGYTEEVFAVSGTTPALSPTNGSIQTWTLTGSSTPTAGTWAAGQSMTLQIDDGSAYTVTWTSLPVTWKTNAGAAPTLNTTGFTVIQLWKVGTTIFGARVGDA